MFREREESGQWCAHVKAFGAPFLSHPLSLSVCLIGRREKQRGVEEGEEMEVKNSEEGVYLPFFGVKSCQGPK